MKRRTFLVAPTALSFTQVLGAAPKVVADQSDGVPLALFVTQKRPTLRLLARFGREPNRHNDGDISKVVSQMESESVKFFEPPSKLGDSRYQFYLGMFLKEISAARANLGEVESSAGSESAKWLKKAAGQGHPGATYLMCSGWISSPERRRDLKKAILLGSIDALAEMSGVSSIPRENWHEIGPVVQYFDDADDACFHWLVTYFFLLRFDPTQRHFSLSLPVDEAFWLNIINPDMVNLEPGRLRDILSKARNHVGRMNVNYAIEEVYVKRWDMLAIGSDD